MLETKKTKRNHSIWTTEQTDWKNEQGLKDMWDYNMRPCDDMNVSSESQEVLQKY